MNKTKVTYMDVDSLVPYANNPRLNDKYEERYREWLSNR
jgi:hypothetical protein